MRHLVVSVLILPVADGGATTLQNLQLLCADCNRSKSDSI